MMTNIKKHLHQKKEKGREAKKKEKTLVMNLFIHDKLSKEEISKLLNIKLSTVQDCLFGEEEIFKHYDNRTECLIGRKTAYWETEKQLEESFNPQYSVDDLKGWESIWIGFSAGDIKTKTIMSKFK